MKNKFRVWDDLNSGWIDSSEIKLKYNGEIDWTPSYDFPTHGIVTIQFSTGLFDKNNKEIFEGDILFGETRNDPKTPTFTGIVEFHQPTASFLIRSEEGFTRGLNSLYNPEIIGNIYEKL